MHYLVYSQISWVNMIFRSFVHGAVLMYNSYVVYILSFNLCVTVWYVIYGVELFSFRKWNYWFLVSYKTEITLFFVEQLLLWYTCFDIIGNHRVLKTNPKYKLVLNRNISTPVRSLVHSGVVRGSVSSTYQQNQRLILMTSHGYLVIDDLVIGLI